MSYQIPRHWEEDRPVTFEEWEQGCELCGREPGVVCMDCDVRFTSFDQVARRMTDESMIEVAFSEEDVTPMYEIICTKCAEKSA